jgi:hypothetical protein
MGQQPKDSPSAFAVRFLGIQPHDRQRELLEARAPLKVAACGRRFGKTLACAIENLWFACAHPGTVQMVVAPTHDQARILWDTCRDLAERSALAGILGTVLESPFPELELVARDTDGRERVSRIMARSASHDGRYIRGHGVDRVTVDEAAYVPDTVLTQTIPPMLAASPFGEMLWTSTPFGTSGAFFEAFERGQRGDMGTVSFQFPTAENPRVSADYLARQRELMTNIAYRTEYLAEFLSDQASVFSPALITSCLDDTIEPGPRDGHHYVVGYDPARYRDRAGVVVLDVTETPHVAVDVRDIGGREYLRQAAAIRELARWYNDARVLLDSTSHDQMLEELHRQGVMADGYTFTNTSKNELIDALVIAMEHGRLKVPRHSALIRELTYYRFAATPTGHVKLGAPDGAGHFDDLVTALALAIYQANSGYHRIEIGGWRPEYDDLLAATPGDPDVAVAAMQPFAAPESVRPRQGGWSFRDILRYSTGSDPWGDDSSGVGY